MIFSHEFCIVRINIIALHINLVQNDLQEKKHDYTDWKQNKRRNLGKAEYQV